MSSKSPIIVTLEEGRSLSHAKLAFIALLMVFSSLHFPAKHFALALIYAPGNAASWLRNIATGGR